jgi:hypothetical protein
MLKEVRKALVKINAKREELSGESRKITHKALAIDQFDKTVKELEETLIPFFNEQGRSMVSRLKKTSVGPKETGETLAKKIFDPKEWNDELTNRVLPVLAVAMAEASVAHLLTVGIDVRKKGKKEKATTASEWADENKADWDSLMEAFSSSDVPIGILSEIPPWMRKSITERLTESFGEDYWDAINETTLGNAETVLRQGLERGESIATMAGRLREYFLEDGFRYARARSENIARTESGNALNSARKDSVAKLQEELDDRVPMKQSWISVLGNTTRPSHADLDGVPEDKNGMWTLGGIVIPWPAHTSLPPHNRCNCQCGLTIEFGMNDAEALQLIEDHAGRIAEEEQ